MAWLDSDAAGPFHLALSTNPFVNRFAEPHVLIRTLGEDVGIGRIQLTHEFINPAWPAPIVRRLTDEMAQSCATFGVKITSMMTGPYSPISRPTSAARRSARNSPS
jgi:D-erythrulose 1-phosphate 3-epimerase